MMVLITNPDPSVFGRGTKSEDLHMSWQFGCGVLLVVSSLAMADDGDFSLPLQTLEHDLTSEDYRAVLATMIPTDLRAEWQRVGTPDNYHLFAKQHGGLDALSANPDLKKSYDRRKEVADKFLQLMREAYDARKQKPPFADPALLTKVLESADRRGQNIEQSRLSIEPILPAAGAMQYWPGLRGPTQQGLVLNSKLPPRWDQIWKTSLPGKGNSAPVVWGDRIFITAEGARPESAETSPDRFLIALDRKTGDVLWKHAAPKPSETEKLYWKNTFASSSVVTDGEHVIAFLGNSGLLCCDVAGNQLWHADLGTFPTMHGPGTTPVLYKDLVIVIQDQTKGHSLFAAYDKRTGQKRWQRDRRNQPGWSSPVVLRIGDRDELIYNGANVVSSHHPDTGEEIWRIIGSSEESIPMMVWGGGLLYSSSGRNGPIFAIRPGGNGDITESHIVWRNERGGPHVPTPAYRDGNLYIINDTGILTCLNALTGETVWQHRLRGRFSMSPLVVDELLLIISEDGFATVFRAGDKYESVAEHDIGESVLASPALVDERLYVRTASSVICIGAAP